MFQLQLFCYEQPDYDGVKYGDRRSLRGRVHAAVNTAENYDRHNQGDQTVEESLPKHPETEFPCRDDIIFLGQIGAVKHQHQPQDDAGHGARQKHGRY